MTTYPNDQGNPAGAIPVYVVPAGGGSVQISVQNISAATLATAQHLTVPQGTTRAVVYASGSGAVNWLTTGAAPTATVGVPLAAGSNITFTGAEMAAVQFIEATGGAVILNIAYY